MENLNNFMLNILLGLVILTMIIAPISVMFSYRLDVYSREKIYKNAKYAVVAIVVALALYFKLKGFV